ncbi:MAG: S53 family peptidase [Burkholderiales bacterium]|nr:S53 family peptidase [Burkholderiales bacterium]
MYTHQSLPSRSAPAWVLAACVALLASACGGGSTTSPQTIDPAVTDGSSGTSAPPWSAADMPADAAGLIAQPAFHLAPVLLDPPPDIDAVDNMASAHRPVHLQAVPADRATLRTRGLTVQTLESASRARILSAAPDSDDGMATPMAASSVATYTPAQIRAAYGLPALPAAGVTPTADQAAQLGAGQTIYIVDAHHNPNTAAELAAFNAKFGLPTCTTRSIATTAKLPLPAPSTTEGCTLSIVYNTAAGGMTTKAPTYESGWATEIALDVQWAHATAPYARIVLIEAASAYTNDLLGGIKLANAMGPGPVSMSFGANEGSYTSAVDPAFTGTGMTYLAATGDWGAQVSWPSVSTYVLAVGGTRLSWAGSGARVESGWTGTGGGTSAYVATPVYQNNSVPGLGTPARRVVADVAFNADPASGQYTAVMSPGSSSVRWVSTGGTSLSTPQWAGLIAVANAMRAQSGKTALGSVHAQLYGQIGAVPGSYASVFTDITSGSNGSCAACTARAGHDLLTGLGTPNGTALLSALVGTPIDIKPPVLAPAAVTGRVGAALSYKLTVSASNAVSYTLGRAPTGLVINSTGTLTWAKPVLGKYAVVVTARDTRTGLTGTANVVVTIEPAPLPPVVASATVTGRAGTALSFSVNVKASNPVSYTLTGARPGMTISGGVVSWPSPVAGTYTVKVTAKDSATGLAGTGTYTIKIEALPVAPVVTSASVNGKAGTALKYSVVVKSTNGARLAVEGVPVGMSISATGAISWAKPVAGAYTLTVRATDNKNGLTGQGTIKVNIAKVPKAPVITSTSLTGVAGKVLTGAISISDDPDSKSLNISVTGLPRGMAPRFTGSTLQIVWTSPVKGNYTLAVTARNSFGLTSKLSVPVKIAAN